jgi:hypothetical protein
MSIGIDNYSCTVVVDGVSYRVTVTVDLGRLAHGLARKAIANKSRKTKLRHGDIVVKAVQQ